MPGFSTNWAWGWGSLDLLASKEVKTGKGETPLSLPQQQKLLVPAGFLGCEASPSAEQAEEGPTTLRRPRALPLERKQLPAEPPCSFVEGPTWPGREPEREKKGRLACRYQKKHREMKGQPKTLQSPSTHNCPLGGDPVTASCHPLGTWAKKLPIEAGLANREPGLCQKR